MVVAGTATSNPLQDASTTGQLATALVAGPSAAAADRKFEVSSSSELDAAATKRALVARKVSDVIEAMGFGWWQGVLTLLVALLYCSDSVEATLLSFLYACAGAAFDVSGARASSIVSIVFAGEFLSAIAVGATSDAAVGRRWITLASAGVIVVFGLASALAPSYAVLVAMRFGVGLGIGTFAVTFDLLAESIAARCRGHLLMRVCVGWALGAIYVAAAAWILLPALSWRSLVLAATLPALAAFVYLWSVVEESALWWAERGRFAEAAAVVRAIQKRNADETSPTLAALRALDDAIITGAGQEEGGGAEAPKGTTTTTTTTTTGGGCDGDRFGASRSSVTLRESLSLFTAKFRLLARTLPRRAAVASAVWTVMGISYYGVTLVVTSVGARRGTDDDDLRCSFDYPFVFSIFVAELVGLLLAFVAIDRLGRVASLASAYVIALVCLFTLPGVLGQTDAALVVLFVGLAATTAGSGILWTMTPELFPTPLRATAHTLVFAFSRLGAFASGYLFDGATLSVSQSCITIGTLMLIAAILTLDLPETSHTRLE